MRTHHGTGSIRVSVCVWWVGGEHAQGPNKQKDSGHSQKHEIYNDIPKYSTF